MLLCLMGPQSYAPTPPPPLPKVLSETAIKQGEALFEKNYWPIDQIEIHNYLGATRCSTCHDQQTPLKGESLAKNYGTLREKINDEITKRCGGTPLPLKDPAMDAIVQYLTRKYRLQDFKILE